MADDEVNNLFDLWISPFANFLRAWDYQPNTNWFDHLFTINWNSKDSDVEQHVLGEVGSYGLQLSRILDAVDLLVRELDLSRLTPAEQQIVVRLEDLARSAGRAVDDYRGRPSTPPPVSRTAPLPRTVTPGPG